MLHIVQVVTTVSTDALSRGMFSAEPWAFIPHFAKDSATEPDGKKPSPGYTPAFSNAGLVAMVGTYG
jgi:hypothetical protein